MRQELLNGKLEFPGVNMLIKYADQESDIKAFWKAIWQNWLQDKETNSLAWYNQLGINCFNDVVRRLSHHNWIISSSRPGRKWADIQFNPEKLFELGIVTPDELQDIRTANRYQKYLLDITEARASKLVKQNGKTKRTGLVREGFRDAGNTQFGYDMAILRDYEESVKLNLTKSMDKIRDFYPQMQCDSASYDQVSTGIFDWHSDNQYETFTTGNNFSDSRGRAISQVLGKVANPISNKDFRAALVITYDE